jgi:hypothetical protein
VNEEALLVHGVAACQSTLDVTLADRFVAIGAGRPPPVHEGLRVVDELDDGPHRHVVVGGSGHLWLED